MRTLFCVHFKKKKESHFSPNPLEADFRVGPSNSPRLCFLAAQRNGCGIQNAPCLSADILQFLLCDTRTGDFAFTQDDITSVRQRKSEAVHLRDTATSLLSSLIWGLGSLGLLFVVLFLFFVSLLFFLVVFPLEEFKSIFFSAGGRCERVWPVKFILKKIKLRYLF